MTGMVPKDVCKPENLISAEPDCNPPAPGSSGSKVAPKAAANSGNLIGNVVRPEGEYNTTKGKLFKMITAPGVARNIDDSNIPFTVRETSEEAQLDSYLKEMVNSQLAAQGVPTNEPFQSLGYAETFQGQRSVAPEPFQSLSYAETFQGQRSVAPEPFQSLGYADPISNASEYMKKVFRGVLA